MCDSHIYPTPIYSVKRCRRRCFGAGSSRCVQLCWAPVRDLEGLRQSILYFHTLFLYAKDSFHIEDQLVDGDKVVTRMTANVQIRETGEPVTLPGINIARIVDGKLVEEWNTWEQTKATEKLKPSVLSA